MLMPVQTDRHILRENLVFGLGLGGIFAVDLTGIAPFGRAMFLPLAIITGRGQVDGKSQGVDKRENEDSFQAVLTPYNMKRLAHDCAEFSQKAAEAVMQSRSRQQSQPHHRHNAEAVEKNVAFGKLIVPHGSSTWAFSRERQ